MSDQSDVTDGAITVAAGSGNPWTVRQDITQAQDWSGYDQFDGQIGMLSFDGTLGTGPTDIIEMGIITSMDAKIESTERWHTFANGQHTTTNAQKWFAVSAPTPAVSTPMLRFHRWYVKAPSSVTAVTFQIKGLLRRKSI